MKKKALVTILGAAFALAIYWLGFINGVYYIEDTIENETEPKTRMSNVMLSDEELMNSIIENEYGDECYGVLFEDDGDNYIEYTVYFKDGRAAFVVISPRDVYTNMYANQQ